MSEETNSGIEAVSISVMELERWMAEAHKGVEAAVRYSGDEGAMLKEAMHIRGICLITLREKIKAALPIHRRVIAR